MNSEEFYQKNKEKEIHQILVDFAKLKTKECIESVVFNNYLYTEQVYNSSEIFVDTEKLNQEVKNQLGKIK